MEIKLDENIGYYNPVSPNATARYYPLLREIRIHKNFVREYGEYKYLELIVHEYFHDVLLKHIGWEACLMWDNISGGAQIEQELLR